LPGRQALRAVLGIAEGLASDHDAIDPGLELAGDGEVVHRRADHDDVGRLEFVHHLLAQLRCGAFGVEHWRPVGQGLRGEIAVSDLQ